MPLSLEMSKYYGGQGIRALLVLHIKDNTHNKNDALDCYKAARGYLCLKKVSQAIEYTLGLCKKKRQVYARIRAVSLDIVTTV